MSAKVAELVGVAPLPDLLTLARGIAKEHGPLPPTGTPRADIDAGEFDQSCYVLGHLRAIQLGMSLAADWHALRGRQTPDVFESEFHEISSGVIRALSARGEQP